MKPDMEDITLSDILSGKKTLQSDATARRAVDVEALAYSLGMGEEMEAYRKNLMRTLAEVSAYAFNAENVQSFISVLPTLTNSNVRRILIDSMFDEALSDVLDSGVMPSAQIVTPPKSLKRTKVNHAVGRLFL